MAAAAVVALTACSSDIEEATLLGFDSVGPRELKASVTDVVLDGYNEDAPAVDFVWGAYDLAVSNPQYKVPDDNMTMYLEFSKNEGFSPVDTALLMNGYMKTFTHSELNLIVSMNGYEKKVNAPMFVRVRYLLGENKPAQYSRPVELSVTPYGILFDRMDMLDSGKKNVLGSLYSPTENGVYQGFVSATADWMNFYLREKDNTIWGCVPNQAYNLSNDEDDMWNLWFPTSAGSYRLTADVNERVWVAEQLTSMKLVAKNGKSRNMKFSLKDNAWTAVVTITAGETFSAKATTRKYDNNNKDGVDGANINLDNIITIDEPGTWLVTINMGGWEPTASYGVSEEGESYDPVLLMLDTDNWNNVKCRLYSAKGDGKYIGFYRTTKGWENFLLATEGRETIYGSLPGSQFVLDSSSKRYNLWVDEKVGLYLYSVNLPESSWSYRYINKLTVAGSFNGGSTTANPMSYDASKKVWFADLNITEVGWGMQILVDGKWEEVFKSTGTGTLGYCEGDNIMPPGTGKYRLTINLYDMQHITYEFTAK